MQGLHPGVLAENHPCRKKIAWPATNGCQQVAETNDPTLAAIAPFGAEEIYGLKTLATGLEDSDGCGTVLLAHL